MNGDALSELDLHAGDQAPFMLTYARRANQKPEWQVESAETLLQTPFDTGGIRSLNAPTTAAGVKPWSGRAHGEPRQHRELSASDPADRACELARHPSRLLGPGASATTPRKALPSRTKAAPHRAVED